MLQNFIFELWQFSNSLYPLRYTYRGANFCNTRQKNVTNFTYEDVGSFETIRYLKVNLCMSHLHALQKQEQRYE